MSRLLCLVSRPFDPCGLGKVLVTEPVEGRRGGVRSAYDSGQSMHIRSGYERSGAPTSTDKTINRRDSSYSRCHHLSCHHSRRRSRSERDIGHAFGSRLTMDGGALDGRVPKASVAGSADLGGGILFVHTPVAAAGGRRCTGG